MPDEESSDTLPRSLANRPAHRYNRPLPFSDLLDLTLHGRRVKFTLLDRIEHVDDSRLVGVKVVSLAEEYLADHFPTFPVLPGVLMLEAATQAASFLHWHRSGFAHSMVLLKDVRNLRYGHFVSPGRSLRVDVAFQKDGETGPIFKVEGTVDTDEGTKTAVTGRIELSCFNWADRDPEMQQTDRDLIDHHRRRWAELSATGTSTTSLLSDTSAPVPA